MVSQLLLFMQNRRKEDIQHLQTHILDFMDRLLMKEQQQSKRPEDLLLEDLQKQLAEKGEMVQDPNALMKHFHARLLASDEPCNFCQEGFQGSHPGYVTCQFGHPIHHTCYSVLMRQGYQHCLSCLPHQTNFRKPRLRVRVVTIDLSHESDEE